MKRSWFIAILLVIAALYLFGCSSRRTRPRKC